MFEARDELRFTRQSDVEDLERDAAIELEVARRVNHAHAATTDFGFELVAGSREVGKRRYVAQMVEDGIAQFHRRRISSRNSRSPAVTPRSRSVTNPRSVRRAQARWLVTDVSAMPWSAAKAA